MLPAQPRSTSNAALGAGPTWRWRRVAPDGLQVHWSRKRSILAAGGCMRSLRAVVDFQIARPLRAKRPSQASMLSEPTVCQGGARRHRDASVAIVIVFLSL